jgi:aminotransferase
LVYGVEHVCVPALAGMQKRTILLGGFSKDYAMTGWRVGFACAPADILAGMRKVHQYTIMSAPTTGQQAALAGFTEAGNEAVEFMRAEYDRRRRLVVDGFNAIGMDCFEPRGAFYAFPSIARSGLSGEDFAMKLLAEEEVAMVPGEAFGPSGAGFMRVSYATAYEKLAEALTRIERFMKRQR